MTRHALVLSGGGAYGAFQVGLMKALAAGRCASTGYQPLEPDVYTGTSVGAYNATYLAAQGAAPFREAAARLETVWRERISRQEAGDPGGVFRYRFNPLEYLNPWWVARHPAQTFAHFVDDTFTLAWEALRRVGWILTHLDEPVQDQIAGLFDFSAFLAMDPMIEMLLETIEFDQVRRSPKILHVAATDWSTGELVIAGNRDMTDAHGPLLVQASASIPGVFPPQEIDGDLFVDGGVLMNAPLEPATTAGADVLHVLEPHPRVEELPERAIASTVGATLRAQAATWSFILEGQVDLARTVNWTVEALGEHAGAQEAVREVQRKLSTRPVTLHVYRPSESLGDAPLEILLFGRDRIEAMIERGFQDATEHDCVRDGCVVVGQDVSSPPSTVEAW